MIEGLKLRIPSSEIAAHCRDRAAHHRKRAEEKRAEVPGIKDALDRLKVAGAQPPANVATMSKGGYRLDSEDVVENLERDIRDHENKAMVFIYFAGRLFDEDYTLDETDLQRLEILRR